MSWKPIFTASERDVIEQRLREMADVLVTIRGNQPWLMHGELGSALFLLHYCFWKENEYYYQHAADQLSACRKRVAPLFSQRNSMQNNPTGFENGLSGFGWGIRHLFQCDMAEGDLLGGMSLIDPELFQHMIYDTRREKCGLLKGAAGIALYALGRKDRFVREFLERFVRELYLHMDGWKSCGDFSIPTGLAGLLLVLLKIREKFQRIENLTEVIERLTGIFRNQSECTFSESFPGWCENRVGILWAQLQLPDTREKALEQWLSYGDRWERVSISFEAGLYGGNFSLGHLFNRIFQLSGKTDFCNLARDFFRRGLDNATFIEKKTGNAICLTGSQGIYGLHNGLLGGLAGIGLALMGAISEKEPVWDEVLLLS